MKHKFGLFIFTLAVCVAFATQGWAQQNAPTEVEAAPGNGMAAVSFTAPAAEGGSSITGYTVVSNPAGGIDNSAGTTAVFHIVTGLNNGTVYTFTVKATNSLNHSSSASSASNSVTPSDSAYAAYAGTWNAVGMITGTGSPWGQRCVQTLSADGSYDLTCTPVEGPAIVTKCSAWLFPYGMATTCDVPTASDYVCYGNTAGGVNSVMACTGSLNGSAYFVVGVKQGSGYSNSNIFSTNWYGQSLGIKEGGVDYWEQEISPPVSVSSTGLTTVTDARSDSATPSTFTGDISVGSDGLVTFDCTSQGCGGVGTKVYWNMDAGKSVAAGFTSYSANDDIEISILGKKAGSFTTADLAGYWAGNELESNGKWVRSILEVNADGSFINSQVESDGTPDSDAGTLAISSGGLVTVSCPDCPTSPSIQMAMDAGKTVMSSTQTHTGSNSGSSHYSIQVFTKVASLWPNAVAFTDGWMGGIWLGNFNVNGAPWIYHETLGWLYPVTSGPSTDGFWFYDPQWDGTGGWWWTSSSLYPWIYSTTQGAWLYYDAADSTPGARWFFNGAGQASTH